MVFLVRTYSAQPTCLPRGRWRHRRNLRRVPTTDLGRRWEGRKQLASPTEFGASPLVCFFSENREPYIHRPAQKVDQEKKRTDKNQRKSGPIAMPMRSGFGQLNVRYQSQNLSKAVPKMSSRFLLRSQLMGTSGSFGRWHSPQFAHAAQLY